MGFLLSFTCFWRLFVRMTEVFPLGNRQCWPVHSPVKVPQSDPSFAIMGQDAMNILGFLLWMLLSGMLQQVKLQRSQAMQIFYFRSSSLPVSQRHCTKIPSSRVDKSPVVAHLQNSLFCAYRMSVQHNLTRSLLSSLSLIMLLHTCAWVYYIPTFLF